MSLQTPRLPIYILILILIPLEIIAALLAYETIGEIVSAFFFLLILINIPLLFIARISPKGVSIISLLIAIALVPYQLILAHRLYKIQSEATLIVTHIYETKIATGNYPTDLSTYKFNDPNTAPYIQRYQYYPKQDAFILTFYVSTPNTSHWFDSRTGWGYYPD